MVFLSIVKVVDMFSPSHTLYIMEENFNKIPVNPPAMPFQRIIIPLS